jgi:ABC-type spermidine/putrescine transport system permease subunit II
MLFIGQPQNKVLQSAGHSIELTFIVAAILLAIAILPAYWMSRYIARQLE